MTMTYKISEIMFEQIDSSTIITTDKLGKLKKQEVMCLYPKSNFLRPKKYDLNSMYPPTNKIQMSSMYGKFGGNNS